MNENIFTGRQVLVVGICVILITAGLFTVVGYDFGAKKMAERLNEYVYIRSVTDADNMQFDLCYNKLTNQMYYYEVNKPFDRKPIWIFENDIMRPAYYPADN